MPRDAFIEIDSDAINRDIANTLAKLGRAGELVEEKYKEAMLLVAEDILAEAQAKAPHDEGTLQGSGQVVATGEGEELNVLIGFNVVYARIRDLGGVIRPVRAKALFIPLRKGVRPGQPGLQLGVDFQLVPGPMTKKKEVRQIGNKYLTGTFEDRKGSVSKDIGKVLKAFLVEVQ